MLQLLGGRALKAVPGVLLGACCAVAIACSGARPRTAAPEPASAQALPASGQASPQLDAHAEIEALDRQIADELVRAQIAQPAAAACAGPACRAVLSEPFVTPTRTDPQCRPAASDRCNDTCTLATSICTSQDKICRLAKQLDGDDWAARKCETARASCKAAHERCCSCIV
jgi:hypothetical protein